MIEKSYYNVGTLELSLAVYEGNFDMPSSDFYRAYLADDPSIEFIRGFHRRMWASLYREHLQLLRDDELPARLERELELA